MKKKYLSVIALAAVFALTVIICVVINSLNTKRITAQNLKNANTTPPVIETQIIEQGGTTAIVPLVTTSPEYNSPSGIINDYLDGMKNKPVINNPAYGPNYHNVGGVDYYLDGQAVTTVYDTVESTKNGDTTAPEPEETTAAVTTKKPETSKVPDTSKAPEQTTVVTTTTPAETETDVPEETTGTDETTEAVTAPVDNSEGEMISEGE